MLSHKSFDPAGPQCKWRYRDGNNDRRLNENVCLHT
jgi:hypothetical protein